MGDHDQTYYRLCFLLYLLVDYEKVVDLPTVVNQDQPIVFELHIDLKPFINIKPL